jgi:lipid-binding SYLF domain-containing protein
MKKLFWVTILVVGLSMISASSLVYASEKEVKRVETSTQVLNEIMAIPEQSIPPALLRNAKAVAVLPGVIKAGLILGGRGGYGILVVHNEDGSWSNPNFIGLAGGGIGLQIGAQATDFILVFKSRKDVDTIVKGKTTLGADVGVAAGPVGRQAAAATDFKAAIYSYSRSKGVFAGVSLEGSTLQMHPEGNERYYGKKGIAPDDIFAGKGVETPPSAVEFKKTLGKYSTPSE